MPIRPSEKEEEYFARLAFEKKKKAEEDLHQKMKQEEKSRLKKLHHMHCPKCGMGLIEIDYKKIKVDKCSECGGVWLDQGELETISHFEKTKLDKFLGIFVD